MTNKFICGLALVLLILGAVWLVRSEGEKNRMAIRQASDQIEENIADGIVGGAEQTLEKAAQLPARVLRDVKDVILPSADTDSNGGSQNTGSQADPDSSSKADGDRVAEQKGTATEQEPSNEAAPQTRKPEKKQPKAKDVLADIFELGREITKTVDDIGQEAIGLSSEEEIRIGEQLHHHIKKKHKVSHLPNQKSRMERLADPLLNQHQRKDIKYIFTVIDSDEINAFSHLGGYIYVNTGLLNFVANDVELQFVV
ncbi:unnamed protein product, partial [marine sediment metagenome]